MALGAIDGRLASFAVFLLSREPLKRKRVVDTAVARSSGAADATAAGVPAIFVEQGEEVQGRTD